jgi:hypothetical protein
MNDVNLKILLIILFYMFGETPIKPKFIKKITDDFPIYKWIILYFIIQKKDVNNIYFIIILLLYQIFYILDDIFNIK